MLTVLLIASAVALAAILSSAYVLTRRGAGSRRELHDAFYEPFEQITVWIDTFGPAPLTKEAEAFMYSQMAVDEMGFSILEEKARERGSTS